MEDRRSGGSGIRLAGGGGIGILILAVIVWALGGNPLQLLQVGGGDLLAPGSQPITAEQEELGQFVSVVLADTEDVWNALFEQMGRRYQEPTLVLFSGQVASACGRADASVGPFYCPADQQVYIDLRFYEDLRSRLGAPGDFAQAYVIAHEVGHHVQRLLGIMDEVDRARGRVSETEYNRLSVRLELQADFFAGVWAHHAQQMGAVLEPGDLEEALRAAAAIGDDRLQQRSQGSVVPDSFTHGTSAQRVAWFRHGYQTGDPGAGNTFDDAVFNAVTPGR